MKVTIEKVQFEQSIQGQICCLEVTNNIMHTVMFQSTDQGKFLKMFVIDLDHPEKVQILDIPHIRENEAIAKTWSISTPKTAQSGIMLMSAGGKYYHYSNKIGKITFLKKLSKKQNFTASAVTSIVSEEEEEEEEGGKQCVLIGTDQSKLYKYNLQTEKITKLHEWSRDIVEGISYTDSTLWVIVGSSISVFSDLHSIKDLKINTQPSTVEVYEKCSSKIQHLQHKRFIENPNTNSFGWITKNGVVFGSLSESPSKAKVLLNFELPLHNDSVITDLLMSDYHIVLLTQGKQLLIVNQLNNKLVFQEKINLPSNEELHGFKVDYTNNTFWLFSKTSVFEIVVKNEYTNVWRILLEMNEYQKILNINDFPQFDKEFVYQKYGDYLLSKNEFLEASKMYSYSNSDISFTTLKLLEKHDIRSLQNFFVQRLAHSNLTKMQQKLYTSLILWNYVQMQAEDRVIREFLIKYVNKIDKTLAYDVLKYQKTASNLLFYANLVKDYKFVLDHWISLENWYEASKILLLLNQEQYVYQYATVLLSNDPETTVQMWMKLASTIQIYPEKLIKPILGYYSSCYLRATGTENYALNYLAWCVANEQLIASDYSRNTNGLKHNSKIITPLVHSTILYMMITDKKNTAEFKIIEYTRTHAGKFDSNFILNLSLKFDRIETAINLYSDMNLLEEAVNLAIMHKMLETAKRIASLSKSSVYSTNSTVGNDATYDISSSTTTNFAPGRVPILLDDSEVNSEIAIRKPLWIKIARVLLLDPMARKNGKDTKQTITDIILESNGVLTIKDLIPLFDSMTTIANVKDELIKSLEQHADSMQQISHEITNLVNIKKNIINQMELLDKAYVEIKPGTICDECDTFLQTKKFYCFPCGHNFHINCLISAILKGGDFMLSGKIQDLQKKRKADWVKELDQLIAAKCPFCSEISINNIDEPLMLQSSFDDNFLKL
ncbi:hypothetical protein ACO0QE_002688 [Hanseniaspora vineae]